MQIDRSRFLLLTASLAAAACNQGPGPATPDTGGADPAKDKADAKDSPSGAAGGEGGGSQVWLEIEPGTEDPNDPGAASDCDNDVATPVTCAGLSAPAGHCESFTSTKRLCESFPEFMQPRAAEAAVNCMLAASGTQDICDWQIWNQCVGAGLQATCVESGVRDDCMSISDQCGGSIDVFECEQALSAVQPAHTSGLASCIREFCEVPFCVTDQGRF